MTDSTFIGRAGELEELAGHLAHVEDGDGRLVFVTGEAGVGKSRLLEEAIDRSDVVPLAGRAREHGTSPYAPIAGALRTCMRRYPKSDGAADPSIAHLAVLLRELGRPAEDTDLGRIAEVVGDVFANAARTEPLALVLEDLHWADEATFEMLPHLVERLADEPVAIVGLYRPEAIAQAHPMRRLRAGLRREERLHEVALRPLGRKETTALAKQTLGQHLERSLVDLFVDRTQGLPLFVLELADALGAGDFLRERGRGLELVAGHPAPVPESLRDAVLLRTDRISEAARRYIEHAAMAGSAFDLQLVAHVAGGDEGLGELLDARLLIETEEGRGAFRNAMVRHALLEEILRPRWRALHREWAETLESTPASPEVIGEHWAAAGEGERARAAFLRAAGRSCRVHAHRDAIRSYERALDLWPEGEAEPERLEALEALARCARDAGQPRVAVKAWRMIAASPRATEEPSFRAAAHRRIAALYEAMGAEAQAGEARRAAIEAFRAAEQPGEAAMEALAVAEGLLVGLRLKEAQAAAETAVELAGTSGRPDLEARALALHGHLLAMLGRVDEAKELARNGLSLALEKQVPEAAAEAHRRLAGVLEFGSRFDEARDAYETARSYCEANGVAAQAALCTGSLAWVLFRVGEWQRAVETCRQLREESLGGDGERGHPTASLVLGLIHAYRGEHKKARKLLDEADLIARRTGDVIVQVPLEWGFAVVEETGGAAERAAERYRRFVEVWRATEDRHDAIPGLMAAGDFFGEQGMEKDLTRVAEALSMITSVSGNPEALGALAHAFGESDLLRGDPAGAAAQFKTAIDHFGRLEVPLEQARTQYRWGLALLAAGERDRGVQCLRTAYRLARKLGSRPHASRIVDALGEAGASAEEQGGSASSRRGAVIEAVDVEGQGA